MRNGNQPEQTRKDKTMSAWSADDLRAIAENDDLFVSPFREDGTTYGTPTQERTTSSRTSRRCTRRTAR